MKEYKGGNLKGNWLVTRKIDGVQAVRTGIVVKSRADKPLYNVPCGPDSMWTTAEVYLGSWERTVSAVKTLAHREIPLLAVYPLTPFVDSRLVVCVVNNPTEKYIKHRLKQSLKKGYEGLVLTEITSKKQLKVKPKRSWDVKVLGFVEGKGKHKGRLGKFLTSKGGVGTGFTDAQREQYFTDSVVGKVIEVEAMSLTPSGKFRHPRFLRVREDKSS